MNKLTRTLIHPDTRGHYLPLLSLLLVLGSCSDGGPSVAGIEGTGGPVVAIGTISSYGSIYVNGIRFDTATAAIEVGADPYAAEEALSLGMVVHIEGNLTSDQRGVATRVVYDQSLKGPITGIAEIDVHSKMLMVLEQPVIVYDDIVFDGVAFSEFSPGSGVAISGFMDDTGALVATRVAEDSQQNGSGPVYEVEGFIHTLDSVQGQFSINDLTVSYANASFHSMVASELEEGMLVEIYGDGLDDSDRLVADRVRLKPRQIASPPGALLELEGPIEVFDSLAEFQLHGMTVNAATADIVRGTPAALATGTKVVVKGRVDALGHLRARTVFVTMPSDISIRGVVEDIDEQSKLITVLGTSFVVDALTAFEDRSPVADRYINLRQIAVGDTVEVHGRSHGDLFIASRIKRVGGQPLGVGLKGKISGLGDTGGFYMLGMLVEGPATGGLDLSVGQAVRIEGEQSSAGSVSAARLTRHSPRIGQDARRCATGLTCPLVE